MKKLRAAPVAREDEATYTLRAIEQMLGLSRRSVLDLVDAGFVTPTRGARNVYRFGFQDVVVLRTAQTLRAANIPTRRIVRALARLRDALPVAAPLSGLRITAIGDDVAVRESGQDIALETGQLLFDFEVAAAGAVLTFPERGARAAEDEADEADAALARAAALEETDPAAAATAYHEVAARHPTAAVYLALGSLYYEHRRFDAALAVYDEALATFADTPELHYNRAIVLEDLRRPDEALAAYETALGLDAGFADAHWNVARLYEERRMPRDALRHFSAYRRLRR